MTLPHGSVGWSVVFSDHVHLYFEEFHLSVENEKTLIVNCSNRGDGIKSFPIDLITLWPKTHFYLSAFRQLSSVAHACTCSHY